MSMKSRESARLLAQEISDRRSPTPSEGLSSRQVVSLGSLLYDCASEPANVARQMAEEWIQEEGLESHAIGVESGEAIDIRWAAQRLAETRSVEAVLHEYRHDKSNAGGFPDSELDEPLPDLT